MKYLVDVKEVSYATIEVEAESPEDAENKAGLAYYDGIINWDCSDVDYSPHLKYPERGESR